jgi:hypothetical protein
MKWAWSNLRSCLGICHARPTKHLKQDSRPPRRCSKPATLEYIARLQNLLILSRVGVTIDADLDWRINLLDTHKS